MVSYQRVVTILLKGDYMNNKKKLVSSIIVLSFITLLLISIPTVKANSQFVLSSWAYPDEYGQGIEKMLVYENSTGSWLPYYDDATRYYYDSMNFNWNISIGIKLRVYTWFNSTLTGASNYTIGKNYQRHSVTVTQLNGSIVFNQQNFTYQGCYPAINPPLWYYYYDVVLDFLPSMGNIYKAIVTYEVYY